MKKQRITEKTIRKEIIAGTMTVLLLLGGGTAWAKKGDKIQLEKNEPAKQEQKAPEQQQKPDPFRDLFNLRQEMEQLFGSTLNPYWDFPEFMAIAESEQQPMDLRESSDAFIVQMDLPGLNKSDIAIEVKDHVLTVRGERQQAQQKKEDETVIFLERSLSSFNREVMLPKSVKADEVTAEYKAGVLTITLPKVAKDEGVRKIEIK